MTAAQRIAKIEMDLATGHTNLIAEDVRCLLATLHDARLDAARLDWLGDRRVNHYDVMDCLVYGTSDIRRAIDFCKGQPAASPDKALLEVSPLPVDPHKEIGPSSHREGQ